MLIGPAQWFGGAPTAYHTPIPHPKAESLVLRSTVYMVDMGYEK